MAAREASAQWKGDLKGGKGHLKLGSGAFEGDYGFSTRFGGENGTNPEELIGAALAACYAMALSAELGKAGHTPKQLDVKTMTSIEQQDGGFAITKIELMVNGDVPELDENEFSRMTETVKHNCPVAKALAGTKIELSAQLAK